MTATVSEPTAQLTASAPYVGLRPFERRERDLLFGRDKDAQILCDRISSSRLTILYALSGLGKSSLLRALVKPKLEENGTSVVYFDGWSQENPLAAVKFALASLASELGVPDPDCSALSLIDIARLLASANERGLVLVFDQFEEFLVRHARDLDPLRSELAALIRASSLDVAVVITLREEFLAALEPFRQRILNLFQSTYRLENLAQQDLCLAITKPAKLFGGDCEDALANEIIKDLRSRKLNPLSQEADLSGGPQVSLDLPILQLVCQELWKQAPDHKLTLTLYDNLGRTPKIIDSYLRELMPRARRGQVFTARLLTYLAPASGLKYSYSAQDLAEITNAPAPEIEKELSRLAGAGILRPRDYSGGKRYELEHDAFIPVLRVWRAEILERDRRRQLRRRMLAWAAAAVMVVMGISLGWSAWQRFNENARHRQELENLRATESEKEKKQLEDWQTEGQLKELDQTKDAMIAFAASRFDSVASYFLLKRTDEHRFEELRSVLQKYAKLMPPDFAEPRAGEGDVPNAPLSIESSKARTLDPQLFMTVWRSFGNKITDRYGIPVALKIHFVQNNNIPDGRIRVTAGEARSVELDIPVDSREYLVAYPLERLDHSSAKEFLTRFQDDWRPFPDAPLGSTWRLVPQWSLPVWKLAKNLTISKENKDELARFDVAVSPSGITAYQLLLKLERKENRQVFFSKRAAAFLLEHLPDDYQTALEEATSAHGSCLSVQIAAKMQKAGNVFLLPRVLDQLAEQPADPSCLGVRPERRAGVENAGAAIAPKSEGPHAFRLKGPWPPFRPSRKEPDESFSVLGSVAPRYRPMCVYMGQGLANSWIPKNEPRRDIEEGLTAARNELYRQYGVILPEPDFRTASPEGESPTARAVRIEIPGDPDSDAPLLEDLKHERILDGSDPRALVQALRTSYSGTRTLWITPDTVQDKLDKLPGKTKDWLQRNYSITDLKILLRAVIGSEDAGHGDSVRYSSWLLNSLVFWATAEQDPLDAAPLRDHLRRLQQVRLAGRSDKVSQGRGDIDCTNETVGFHDRIYCGAQALSDDNPDEAIRQFKIALSENRKAAEEAFCGEWSRRLPEVWLRDYADLNSTLKLKANEKLEMDLPQSLDLEDLPKPDAPTVARELTIYRIATGALKARVAWSAINNQLDHYGSVKGWPEEQARWVALRFLQQYDPADEHTGTQQEFAAASNLLKSQIARLDQQTALNVFVDVQTLSRQGRDNQNRPVPNWAWKLLADLAQSKPHGGAEPPNLELELAWQLSDEERADRLRQGMALLNDYESVLPAYHLGPEDLAAQNEVIAFARAKTDLGLQRLGDEQRFNEAKRLFTNLLNSKRKDISRRSRTLLLSMLYAHGQDSEAHQVFEKRKPPDDATILNVQMLAQMTRGNGTAVASIARQEEQIADQRTPNRSDDANDALFSAVVGSIITQSGDWKALATRFLNKATEYEYRDYVILIFRAYCSSSDPAAAHFLDERLKNIDPSTWKQRLLEGDTRAWREMLLWRFKEDPQVEPLSKDLLNTVENEEKWKRSPLSQLPMSQRGQRCEAWFYEAMRAKTRGQTDRMRDCLKKCIAAGFVAYEEYAMASFRLKQEESRQSPAVRH